MIETLSSHWDMVLEHLNRMSRLPTYRFHMREVGIFRIFRVVLADRSNLVLSLLQPSTLDECFRLDTAYLARLFIIRCILDQCWCFP